MEENLQEKIKKLQNTIHTLRQENEYLKEKLVNQEYETMHLKSKLYELINRHGLIK